MPSDIDGLWQWLGWLVAAVLTGALVLKFDLNEFLKERRKQQKERLRMLCPHVRMTVHDGQPAVRSTYISPSGTTAWQCQLCRHTTHDQSEIEESAKIWANDPAALIERVKLIDKRMKKFAG